MNPSLLPTLTLMIEDKDLATRDAQYEIWNTNGFVIRIVHDEDKGTYQLYPAPENTVSLEPLQISSLEQLAASNKDKNVQWVNVHFYTVKECPVWFEPVVKTYGLTSNDTTKKPSSNKQPNATKPHSIFPFPLVLFDSPIAFSIRLYEKLPLRQHAQAKEDVHKWTRVADVAVSYYQLFEVASVPLFIGSDIYIYESQEELKHHPELRKYQGHQRVMAKISSRLPVAFDDLQAEVDTCNAVVKNVIWKEIETLREFTVNQTSGDSPWSEYVQGIYHWVTKVVTPMNYRLTGRLLFPKEDHMMYEFGGVSAQSLWYMLDTEVKEGSTLPVVSIPSATEAWFQRALQDVLAIHGRDVEWFKKQARKLLAYTETTPEWREMMAMVSNVVRIHTTTRHYVQDHNMPCGKWVSTDERTPGFAFPGDCEDGASAMYHIMMSLLFYDKWRSEEISLLRQLAAAVGLPCGVAGTATEPFERQGPKDTHASDGHMFTVVLPFRTFVKAITGREPTGAHLQAFRHTFGYSAPAFHTKPAIWEPTFMCTPYYSDHHHIAHKKKHAQHQLNKWLQQIGEDHYDWDHYATMHIMGKTHTGQGSAFRLFTEAHLFLFPQLECTLLDGKTKTFHPCRSFLFQQPHVMTEGDILDKLFPVLANEVAMYEEDRTRLVERVSKSLGFGLPIELLAHGKQQHDGQPLFRLLATCVLDEKYVRLEKHLMRMYERPIIPLQPKQVDEFAIQSDWQQALLSDKEYTGEVPTDTNDRLTLYVYDIVANKDEETEIDVAQWKQDMETVKKLLRAKRMVTKPYRWCVACIFVL
jgi:hypothetical protein